MSTSIFLRRIEQKCGSRCLGYNGWGETSGGSETEVLGRRKEVLVRARGRLRRRLSVKWLQCLERTRLLKIYCKLNLYIGARTSHYHTTHLIRNHWASLSCPPAKYSSLSLLLPPAGHVAWPLVIHLPFHRLRRSAPPAASLLLTHKRNAQSL